MTTYPALTFTRIRKFCLECAGGDRKAVLWCACDGMNSTACLLWPFRHGKRPETIAARFGDRLIDPAKMPPANVDLSTLPGDLATASTGEISIAAADGSDGYHQPPEEIAPRKAGRKLSAEAKAVMLERLKRGRDAVREENQAGLLLPASVGR